MASAVWLLNQCLVGQCAESIALLTRGLRLFRMLSLFSCGSCVRGALAGWFKGNRTPVETSSASAIDLYIFFRIYPQNWRLRQRASFRFDLSAMSHKCPTQMADGPGRMSGHDLLYSARQKLSWSQGSNDPAKKGVSARFSWCQRSDSTEGALFHVTMSQTWLLKARTRRVSSRAACSAYALWEEVTLKILTKKDTYKLTLAILRR